ncbi:sn-glycerol-3-phosphate acyltransferase 1, chloroplastic [Seminavis robusta]|uniref:1-acyl-sn-glycerol-3-phosphate acyltransferase n=1 Tax=Seminavis robusta TaxID=568900 RepID=A0A9N8F3E0_9STRA|nr:sn-glycerol-3-phosphate acyltransferase 1, chloroplastic [Seminavis robusta]|eukprot:Sro3074_g343240.1 sn-glycerol-3-phosphate acyltransferase 1, chloroplastic (344) ;mRNA; r:3443-4712
MRIVSLVALLQLSAVAVNGFTSSPAASSALFGSRRKAASPLTSSSTLAISTTAGDESDIISKAEQKKLARKELVKQEGGRFAFDTKYGALNPFAIYYGLVSISLGIPWFFALMFCKFLYFVTRGKIDKQRRLPVFLSHVWGTTLMRLTGCYPKMINREILKDYFKKEDCCMFVANHCSWDDIPFLGAAVGWRNYKIVAKKELEKVPILGSAIRVAGNIEVDRTNRRSQLATLKKGIKYLKEGVNLCTFAEGTRSRTGRLMKFKDGAFKMAHKAGVPVIPMAIVGAQKAHPVHWMFPYKPTGKSTSVVVGEPVESKDITEAELSAKVREALIENLPDDQKPLPK